MARKMRKIREGFFLQTPTAFLRVFGATLRNFHFWRNNNINHHTTCFICECVSRTGLFVSVYLVQAFILLLVIIRKASLLTVKVFFGFCVVETPLGFLEQHLENVLMVRLHCRSNDDVTM